MILDNGRVTIFWLDWLPTMLAAVASLVGVVVTVSQLNAASRFRRRASFWSEQLQVSDLAHDRAVVQSFHREAIARLVALSAYPGKKLLVPALFVFTSTYGVGTTGYIAGTLAPSISWRSLQDQGADPSISFAFVLILWLGLYGAASIVVRRRQVALQYLQGQDLSLVQPNEGGDETTAGLKQSGRTTLGVLSFSLGLCLLIAGISFAVGIPKGDPSILETAGGWLLGPIMVGVPLALLGSTSVIDLFQQDSDRWRHPRELSVAAEKLQADQRSRETTDAKSANRRVVSWMKTLVRRQEPPHPGD